MPVVTGQNVIFFVFPSREFSFSHSAYENPVSF